MPPAKDKNFVLTIKCLEFCQALASKGQKFAFSLSIGSNYSFSMDTKENSTFLDTRKVTTPIEGMKKKLSPSQVRRNMKRKEDFLKRKSENSKTVQSEQQKNIFMCNQCDKIFQSENDLKIHKENIHDEIVLPENIEQLDGQNDIEHSEDDSKETQTEIFLKVDKEGILVEPFLDLRCESPPPTVYHPVLGLGKYDSTEACKDDKTGANRRAHCYRFENGRLCEV